MGSTPSAGNFFALTDSTMKIMLVALVLSSAAAAAPFKCDGGGSPRLTGDLFSPAACSSAAAPSPAADFAVPVATNPANLDLKALAGVYEGRVVLASTRYSARLEIKTGWLGRAEATLQLTDIQTSTSSTQSLKLVPGKAPGRYQVVLAAENLPGSELAGELTAGAADASAQTAGMSRPAGMRQLDLRFENGAQYRVRYLPGAVSARARAWWQAPGEPAGTFELDFKSAAPAKP